MLAASVGGLKKETLQPNKFRKKRRIPSFFSVGIYFRSQAALELLITKSFISHFLIAQVMLIAAGVDSICWCPGS